MTSPRLLVNADDFNLTPGTARAILLAHQRGIVSSTSVFTNLPFSRPELERLKRLASIGIGLHLNVTFGAPVARPAAVSSLLCAKGVFRRPDSFFKAGFNPEELRREYDEQFDLFTSIFGRKPDHLNTHHHLHRASVVLDVLNRFGKKYGIPVRRVPPVSGRGAFRAADYFFGSLLPDRYWTRESLAAILKNLPAGMSEIMCHPGFVDVELSRKSSFARGRELEFCLFSDGSLKKILKHFGIQLIPKISA